MRAFHLHLGALSEELVKGVVRTWVYTSFIKNNEFTEK